MNTLNGQALGGDAATWHRPPRAGAQAASAPCHGLVLLNLQGRLAFANERGHEELARGRTLVAEGSGIGAARPEERPLLARALQDARRGHRTMIELGGGVQSKLFSVLPWRTVKAAPLPDAVLLICGLEQPYDADALWLYAQSIGLTDTETAVITLLCRGLNAEDIAQQRRVKLSTVRTQILSIREKAGCHSVLQLVSKVTSLPPAFGPMEDLPLEV